MEEKHNVGWAILGCGRVVDNRVAPVFSRLDDAKLVGFCSRDGAKAKSYCERHGGERPYDSLDALLADDAVGIVYIATPNALHAEHASRCLAAGKHVLVDKPMATDAAAASAMVQCARKSDRLLGVMHQQRFHPANVHLIRLRDEGQLGKLNILRVQIGMWCSPRGGWRVDPEEAGGGVVIDLAPHALDLMLQVGGEVRRVRSQTRNQQFSSPVEDFGCAWLEFADGAIGLLDLSYCSHQYGGRIEAFGTEATFAAEGSMQSADVHYTWFRRGTTVEPMRQEISVTDCYQEAIEDFTDAVLHAGEPSIDMVDGLEVMRVIDAIYASARTDQPVELQPL